jgi:hypothetical protein
MTLPPSSDFGPSGSQPDTDFTQPVPADWMDEPITQTYAPDAPAEPAEKPASGARGVMIALAVGSLVAVAIGVYGKLHEGTGQALNLAGFTSGLHAKVWLASVAFALAIVQVLSALAMWGRLPGVEGGGRGVAILHRWSGRVAVLVSLPVAAHCLYALGFQAFDTRVLVHSLLGCFFYGLFVFKMLILTRDDTPGWTVPVAGSVLFTALTGLWVTSSLWFFSEFGVSF